MPHSHYITVPISSKGNIIPREIFQSSTLQPTQGEFRTLVEKAISHESLMQASKSQQDKLFGKKPIDNYIINTINTLMTPPFSHTDILMYSHGWWTSADAALIDYSRYIAGLSKEALGLPGVADVAALGIGLHWPSMVSDDARSLLNVFEPLTFFERGKMADAVGRDATYTLLSRALGARKPEEAPRIHLIGHSFGCRVVCSALERLAAESSPKHKYDNLTINVVLIQAAFAADAFENMSSTGYAQMFAAFPKLRVLVTKSRLDKALGVLYPAAEKVNLDLSLDRDPQAMGFFGPMQSDRVHTSARVQGSPIIVKPNFSPPDRAAFAKQVVVADLYDLHSANASDPEFENSPSGHHSDIYQTEIYKLISAFMFK